MCPGKFKSAVFQMRVLVLMHQVLAGLPCFADAIYAVCTNGVARFYSDAATDRYDGIQDRTLAARQLALIHYPGMGQHIPSARKLHAVRLIRYSICDNPTD